MRILQFVAASAMALFFLAFTTACGNQAEPKKEVSTVEKTTPSTDTLSIPQNADGLLKAEGILKSAEDAPYPIYNLTLALPGKNTTEDFSINVEDVKSIDVKTLTSYVGKQIAIEYKKVTENALLDLTYKGKSIFPKEEVPASKANLTAITGVLGDAAETTKGDLPDELTIKTAEGVTEKFPYFITESIVKLNGKQVTGYYEKRTHSNVVSVKSVK